MIKLNAPEQSVKRIDEKIIPMINIIFLLLMFFLIMATLRAVEVHRDDAIVRHVGGRCRGRKHRDRRNNGKDHGGNTFHTCFSL